MKSVILFACLIVSAATAPRKTAGLERESPKSARQSFEPTDAQFYTGEVVSEVPVSGKVTVPQVVPQAAYAGQAVFPQVLAAEQVVPLQYSGAYPGVTSVVSGVVPYSSSVGQTTVTTATAPGSVLPAGQVWEHHGQTHFGHVATATHVRKPGTQYAYPQVSSAVPAVQVFQPSQVYNTAAGLVNGQVQYINGQPAQWINGQWYYINAAQAQLNPGFNQAVYTNTLNKANVAPAVVPSYAVPTGVKTYTQQQQTTYLQPGATFAGVRPAIPAQDNKWYTKTNLQPVAYPFYRQPQYVPVSTNTKTRVVPSPDVASVNVEGQKNDW